MYIKVFLGHLKYIEYILVFSVKWSKIHTLWFLAKSEHPPPPSSNDF